MPAAASEPEPTPAEEAVVIPSAPLAEDEEDEKPAAPAPKPAKSDDPFGDDPF